MARKWLITGVSSGLGKALMEAVIAHGDTVTGTVRKILPEAGAVQTSGAARLVTLDVTDTESVARGVSEAVDWMGGLDVVVNNAGAGMFGPVEVCSLEDFRSAMEVNYFGLVSVTQAALPHLRVSRGTLINVASMAAFMAMGGTSPYTASKHAVLGLSEALREELAPLGVKVVAALPGGFRTEFWSERANTIREGLEGVYGAYPSGQVRARSQQHVGNEMGDPARLSQLMIEVAEHDDPPLFLVLGGDALESISAKREAMMRELEAHRAIGSATGFDG